jgi:sigma-B regulation protein RsbU (phosphoserine phosphatase)
MFLTASGISIRNLFILSVSLIIVILVAGIAFIADNDLSYLTSTNIATAKEAIQDVTDENYRLSEKILTHYGQKIVELKAKETASKLSIIFRDLDITNYSALRLNKKLRAVATQPIYANRIQAGYLDLIDNTGEAILHPNRKVEGRNFCQWSEKYPEMWQLVQRSFTHKLVKGFYNFFDLNGNTRRKYMVLAQVEGTPFITVAVINIGDFFMPVQALIREKSEKIQYEAENRFTDIAEETGDTIREHAILWGAGLLVCAIFISFKLAVMLTQPVRELIEGVEAVGEGRFNIKLEEKGPAEIVALATGFNTMGARLNEYIDRVRRESAARQAMESEIAIAADIQESLLPRTFPPFPERREFSLHAINIAAREVGGDFYDFFFIDSENLALIIGDVSGKGIPAALFMAITRTLFRIICPDETDPGLAMEKVNRTLCKDNDACMFVTVFLGYYNVRTGELRYANGGHPDGMIVSPAGGCRSTQNPGSIVLGIEPEASYMTMETEIDSSEMLFLYTDGITEACCMEGSFFGEKRLVSLLEQAGADTPVEEICEKIVGELEEFQGDKQYDDITMIMLRRETVVT